jgi:hypothetical protein
LSGSATWQDIALADHIEAIDGQLLRVVESQEQVATNHIVDSLAEQALLEELLEQSKPRLRRGSENLHYLLQTPFRYRPLRHGSRFGQRHEPSIFYGAQATGTALAEAAYYRLLFWAGMETAPTRPIPSRHTLFSAAYRTDSGMRLQRAPFDRHRAKLADPAHYAATQELGGAMREAGVLAFEFRSARDPKGGINVGLFEPVTLAETRPGHQEEWLCETDTIGVRFLQPSTRQLQTFPIETFLVDGRIPLPAS